MTAKNHTMRILTGIAIILVVLGHIDWNILTVLGIFPYYSFHVLIFVFISGYFYKPEYEDDIPAFIKKKASHLLIPYFAWNLFYGLISTILAGRDYSFCNPITVFNFFIEPFLGGHQYGFNFAAWFVPALFMIEILYIVGRKILSLIKADNDILILVILLAAGIATVYLSQTGHVWGYLKTPGRILFMLPVYQFGRIYNKFEDKLSAASFILWPLFIAIQFILGLLSGGSLNFSAVWCSGFASYPVVPYLTTICGIGFWYTIAVILSKFNIGRVIEKVGDYSFSVMMNHPMFFFMINTTLFLISKKANSFQDFDMVSYKENINYVYASGSTWIWKPVYAVIAIVGSMLIGYLISQIKRLIPNNSEK